jgi:hypothetical protein
MLVREAYDVLRKLIKEGHGSLELFGCHGSSGVSYDISIYGSVREKDKSDDIGPLDELDNGTKYVPIYLD